MVTFEDLDCFIAEMRRKIKMRFYNVTMKPNIIDKWVDKIEKWEEKYIYGCCRIQIEQDCIQCSRKKL